MDPDWVEPPRNKLGGGAEVYTQAAALYVALVKAGYFDEASEFAEWFLETFDLDLET